jgi:hypothetical protein
VTDQAAPAPAPAGGMGPAPKAPSKAGGVAKRIVMYVVVAAVVGLGGLAWKYFSGDPAVAKVGDCLIEAAADDMKTVDCTDAKAAHKVVGKVDGKTEAEFKASDNPCTAYPTAENALWGGKEGSKGYILCLEPVKK